MAAAALSSRSAFAVLVVVFLAFRLWFATTLPISGDEAYHWEWSRRLSAAYYDHPGLTALLIWASGRVLPADSELMVRLPAILCSTGAACAAWAFARRVARHQGIEPEAVERAGCIAGVLVLFVPVLAVLSVYMSTDPPLVLFATLAVWALWEALEGGRWIAWLGAGVALGLAAMSKFLAFLIPPGVLAAILVHRPWRSWLARPQPWVAALAGVAVFAPVLAWNAQHDWATFRFNFGIRHADSKLSWFTPLEYFASQAAMLSPLLLIAALAGMPRAWRQRTGTSRYLMLASAVPIGFFLLSSVTRSVGAHWPAALWIPILVWLAVEWARGREPRLARWTLGSCVALTMLLPFVAHVPPSWTFRLVWGGRPDRINFEKFHERFGWRELGARVDGAVAELQAQDPERAVFVIAGKYGVAAGVAFYTPSQRTVHLWAPRRRHGENYRYWDRFDALRGQSAVFVAKERAQIDGEREGLERHFARVGQPEEIPILVDGERVRSFWIVKCVGFDGRDPFCG